MIQQIMSLAFNNDYDIYDIFMEIIVSLPCMKLKPYSYLIYCHTDQCCLF